MYTTNLTIAGHYINTGIQVRTFIRSGTWEICVPPPPKKNLPDDDLTNVEAYCKRNKRLLILHLMWKILGFQDL
jgi:hypothetical protein